MPIFRTGELTLGSWSFETVDIEGNQSEDLDNSGKFLKATTALLEIDDDEIVVRVLGTFSLKQNVIGLSSNEAIDTGLISGDVNKIVLGFYFDGVFKSAIEISEIDKSVVEISNDFNTDDFLGLLFGNDEIYGNDYFLLDDDGKPSTDTDGAGNVYNGNRLHGYNGNDKIYGGKLIDSLWGDKGNDTLWGYDGNDFIYGGVGSDTLNGGDGNDKLNGGNGSDTLYGGKGNDALHGLSGSDRFVFDIMLSASTNQDTIKDFTKGTDKIVLDDDIFKAFTNKSSISSGQLKVVSTISNLSGDGYLTYVTANDTLYYDADGKGAGDLAFVKVELTGTAAPTFTDFQIIA
jgi:Ca2+-binding RTX toxin-like protein